MEATVRNRGAARIHAGHPWVYRSDISEASGGAGDIVRVVDRKGRFLGRAFYNPRSEISLRMVTRNDEPVDGGWFYNRILTALTYRKTLDINGDAYRLIHAEADGIPGLIVDRYGEYLVLQAGSAAVDRRMEWALDPLKELLSPAGILARNDFNARGREGLPLEVKVLHGGVPGSVVIREGDVLLNVDLWRGQKTGTFLDQRENHLAAGRYAHGKVLDVFSYAGGFGLHTAHKAESVEIVDASEAALQAARANVELNNLTNFTFTRSNAFHLLHQRSDAGEAYDAIILDPPAFAKGRRDLPAALRAYKEINLRAMKLLSPRGVLITCSCSYHVSETDFKDTMRAAATDAGRRIQVREWRGQAPDHPEVLNIPETRYLKCAVLECL